MATWDHELAEPPVEAVARERWLQHAAGFILFEDVRRYALERIDPDLPPHVHAAVKKGIDDAVYGLMMVIQGVTGGLSNDTHNVYIAFKACLVKTFENMHGDSALSEMDLSSDGQICGDYHGWLEGDFGQHPVAVKKPRKA